jgi:tRNA pseudouridine55 synthase
VAQIEAALAQFRGPISQVPPMHSALKRDGKPLYEYARAGITLEREARNVIIHTLELLDYEAAMLRIRVTCSKGPTSACWAKISAKRWAAART